MKIKYSKQRLNSNYKLGLYFTIAGTILTIVSSLLDESKDFEFDSAGFGLIGAGIFSLGIYYYKKKMHYLTIENGFLKKNTLYPKKINLNEVERIKKFAGDYTLNANKKELIINTQIIEEDSLLELNNELKKLNLEWQ